MPNTETMDIVIRIRGAANEALKGINQRLGNMRKQIFSLKTAIAGLGLSFVVRNILQTKNEFVKYQKTLETLEGSQEKANEKWKEMLQFAEETPFKISQVMDSYKTLKAFGLDPTIKTMTVLGDTAAALGGSDVLGRIALVLGQIQAQGFMTAQDMNQLANAGINAGKVMKDTFGAARDEVAKLQDQGVTADMIIEALMKSMEDKFGGQMAKMNKELSGQWEMLISIWERFKVAIMDSGLYSYLRNFFTVINEKIIELRKAGKLDDWAKQISNNIIYVFETMAMGLAGFWDFAKPILKKLKDGMSDLYGVFKSLPTWVQEVGIVGALMLGTRGKLVLIATLDLMARVKKRADELKEYTELGGTGGMAGMIAAQKKAEESHTVTKRIIPKTKLDEIEADKDLSDTQKELKAFFAKLRVVEEEAAEKSKDTSGVSSISSISSISGASGASLSDVAAQKSVLSRMAADSELYFKQLEQLFENGKKTIDEYYSEQITQEKALFVEKKKLLELEITKAKDADDRKSIEDGLYALEKAHQIELLELAEKRNNAEKEMAQQKLRAQEILSDIDVRTKTPEQKVGFGLDSEFAGEQGDMSKRHAEELASLETLVTDKMAIEMGYVDELSLLKDVARQHELEQEQLLTDQQTRLMQARLNLAQEVAGGMSQVFTDMYELSGKKTKEFFYIAKAASIAQATMKMSEAIVGALGSPPYGWGAIAQATLVGIMGAVQIAKITAQQLAGGGEVLGNSPSDTADNVPIWATAKEFVQPVKTVRHYGRGVMEALRTRSIPKEIFSGFRLPSLSMPKSSFALAAGGTVPRAPQQPSSSGQSGKDEGGINIVNVLDDTLFEQYATSTKGQRTYLNIMSQNRYALKQMLAAEG
jgi:tape measure domain-containing protein